VERIRDRMAPLPGGVLEWAAGGSMKVPLAGDTLEVGEAAFLEAQA
jgi:hypothetical protein